MTGSFRSGSSRGEENTSDQVPPGLGCALLVIGSSGTIGLLESYDEVAERLDTAGAGEMLQFVTYDQEHRVGRILLERRFIIGVFETGRCDSEETSPHSRPQP